ncbi:AI-2E family transporter [Oceanicoccus sagamiensis]|uniref:AI-2E family transporter n=1 Tax=Oceanicoccus sagamiensis TaxID=716816 RepID=A0A1X9NLK9_9GAMM|nr:AI-2E family transporter [Oceanicoccus sagamiensis]ARN74823.1 hypothetical protein BST96_12265 [Oceanicoccus sagamiensis]
MIQVNADKQFIARAVEASIKIAAIFVMASWCFDILNPFVTPIVWAGIIAIALKPVSDWVENKLGGKRTWAATIVTLLVLAIVITPAIKAGDGMIEGVRDLSSRLESGEIDVSPPNPKVKDWPLVGDQVHEVWTDASENLQGTAEAYKDEIASASKAIASKVAGFGVSILMFIFSTIIAGFFLAGADGVEKFIHQLARRLAGEAGNEFAKLSSVTVRNVTQGILGVALLQATLAGIGFMVIGLPAVPVLALLVLIMSIIQVNPILLLLPLAIYVFSFASPVAAVVYLVWSIVVGLMDNVLKPLIMGKGSTVPMMVVFLGAIGGFMTLGIVGLFVGAVVVVLGYELFMAWLNNDFVEVVEEKADAEAKQS